MKPIGTTERQAQARLEVSRHACELFWERGVNATSGDDIAAAAGLSTRTVWRYFRSKESCVEPVLALSAQRFIALAGQWPAELSLAEHMASYTKQHPLSDQEIADVRHALRITTMSVHEPAIRTSYLMVPRSDGARLHPRCGRTTSAATAGSHGAPLRGCRYGAFRVIDEDVGRRVIVDGEKVSQEEALDLIDRAVRDATNGRFGGPST